MHNDARVGGCFSLLIVVVVVVVVVVVPEHQSQNSEPL